MIEAEKLFTQALKTYPIPSRFDYFIIKKIELGDVRGANKFWDNIIDINLNAQFIITREIGKQMIANGLACEFLTLEGDGRHWYAVVVSASFEGLSKIRRHQAVYATLGSKMHTDEVHALSMKTYTPAEWAKVQSES